MEAGLASSNATQQMNNLSSVINNSTSLPKHINRFLWEYRDAYIKHPEWYTDHNMVEDNINIAVARNREVRAKGAGAINAHPQKFKNQYMDDFSKLVKDPRQDDDDPIWVNPSPSLGSGDLPTSRSAL